jgi:hypothetical protein
MFFYEQKVDIFHQKIFKNDYKNIILIENYRY